MENNLKKYNLINIIILFIVNIIFLGFIIFTIFVLDDFKQGIFRPGEAILFGNLVAGFFVHLVCSLILCCFLYILLLSVSKYFFPEILFKTKEDAQQYKEKIYSSKWLSWIKKLFPTYYENLVFNYYEKTSDIKDDIVKYIRYFFIALVFCLPFYYLAFNSYFYSTKDYFYFNPFFGFQEKKFDLNEVQKIETKITLSGKRNSNINFGYYLTFKNGKKFNLSKAEVIEISKLDKILKGKGVKKEYLNVEYKAFNLAKSRNSEEYVESINSIFSDYIINN